MGTGVAEGEMSFSTSADSGVQSRLRATVAMMLAGLTLATAGVFTVAGEHTTDPLVVLSFYAVMEVGLPLCAVGGGYYLVKSDFSLPSIRLVNVWFFGGVLLLWSLVVWVSLPKLLAEGTWWDLQELFVLYGGFGGAVGFVAGLNRARARQNRLLVERTMAQQETLEFLNHLLRHNVLNGLQVIDGYRSLLEAHVDEEGRDHLDCIGKRSVHMTELVDNVRVLMRTLSAETELHPIDLAETLRTELAVARADHPDATFETEIPDSVVVPANVTLGAIFENLLTNAVVHSDTDRPTVECRVQTVGDRVEVTVADDGPGIPDAHKLASLRQGERGPESVGDGLGLYLVDTLVGQFGGDVTIRDNDPRGTAVVVTLPLADG